MTPGPQNYQPKTILTKERALACKFNKIVIGKPKPKDYQNILTYKLALEQKDANMKRSVSTVMNRANMLSNSTKEFKPPKLTSTQSYVDFKK